MIKFEKEELSIYSRQMLMEEIGYVGQEKIKNAKTETATFDLFVFAKMAL